MSRSPQVKMRRPTLEEKLATYSVFQVDPGYTVPFNADWRDLVRALGSISLGAAEAGSVSAAGGGGGPSLTAVVPTLPARRGDVSTSSSRVGSISVAGVRAGSSSVAAAGSGEAPGSISVAGALAGSSSVAAAVSGEAPARRKRTPGRWRRIPRILPHPSLRDRPMTWEELLEDCLDTSDEVYCFREEDKPVYREFKAQMARSYQRMIDMEKNGTELSFGPLVLSDTLEQHLTAQEMEAELAGKDVGHQACQFANLAINHYNSTDENTVKIELCTVLLSNCFHESCGSTFAHVNFTARAQDDDQAEKNLYFAELSLDRKLLAKRIKRFAKLSLDPKIVGCANDIEPMRVLSVHNLEGSCFGGCHEINRKIDYVMNENQDYERCHACSDRIKHPYGMKFVAGHDSSKIPYYTAG